MARFARRPRATNSTIRNFYKRGKLLAAQGVPTSLKLSMLGFGRRGGTTLRQEKLRRKLPRQSFPNPQKLKRLPGT